MVIDISHNFDVAIPEIVGFFEKDVPFAVSMAINDVAFRVREQIVQRTYPSAFTVRNARFPGVLWRVDTSNARGKALTAFKRGQSPVLTATVKQQSLRGGMREYIRRHTTGGYKTGTGGGSVAIPVEANTRRLKGGGISKAQKPRAIRNRKTGFVIGKGHNRKIVVRGRGAKKKELETRFILKPQVKIPKRFNFYSDAYQVATRDIDSALYFAMRKIAARSRRVRVR